ncbi:MAG TPA: cupin domain-containing protein [Gaiellales bacterium]|jgi:quercetin dioxygenase-like cupin family protein|nr:cupin domain-containing protein [Gaiellales bacterium]
MSEPRSVRLSGESPAFHDAGIEDRELVVDGVRWALVEYGAGQGRADWCHVPHCGYVVGGALRYEFEDGREPLVVEAGDAFVLPPAPGHRGRNDGSVPASLFLIDALPERG